MLKIMLFLNGFKCCGNFSVSISFFSDKYKNTNRMSCDCRRLHVLTLVRNFESSVGEAYGEMLTLILPSQLTYRG